MVFPLIDPMSLPKMASAASTSSREIGQFGRRFLSTIHRKSLVLGRPMVCCILHASSAFFTSHGWYLAFCSATVVTSTAPSFFFTAASMSRKCRPLAHSRNSTWVPSGLWTMNSSLAQLSYVTQNRFLTFDSERTLAMPFS